MEAVGNLARILEETRRHAAAIEALLDQEEPDICLECGRPRNDVAGGRPDWVKSITERQS